MPAISKKTAQEVVEYWEDSQNLINKQASLIGQQEKTLERYREKVAAAVEGWVNQGVIPVFAKEACIRQFQSSPDKLLDLVIEQSSRTREKMGSASENPSNNNEAPEDAMERFARGLDFNQN